MPSWLLDHLHDLECVLACRVSLAPARVVRLGFNRYHAPGDIKKARALTRRYDRLLPLQIHEGRSSVQKLLAYDKVRIQAGQYRLAGAAPEAKT